MAEQKSVGSFPHTSPATIRPLGNCKVGTGLQSVKRMEDNVLLAGHDHPDLSAFVAGAVREQAIVVAARAERADRHVPDA